MQRFHPAVVCAALVLLTLAVYAPVAKFGFVDYDDPDYVTKNELVQGGLSWQSASRAISAPHFGNWHPVTWLSHMADAEMFGMNPAGHHLVNVAIHAANGVVLYLLLLGLLNCSGTAAFVAAAFLLHPQHVESVAWVSERKDVLSAFFGFLALAAYVRYAKQQSAGRYLTVLVLLALGLMSKPMLVTWPFLLLILDWWPLNRFAKGETRKAFVEKAPLLLMALAVGIITLAAQAKGGAVATLDALPVADRVLNAFRSYAVYIGKTFWPSGLSPLYLYKPVSALEGIPSTVAIIAASVAAFRLRHHAPLVTFGWFWYIVTLVPVIGFLQAGVQARADRYTYIPLIGIFIIAAWGAKEIAAQIRLHRFALPALAMIAILAMSAVTSAQMRHWRDATSLLEREIETDPANGFAHIALGNKMLDKGDIAGAQRHFDAARQSRPDDPDVRYHLGMSMLRMSRDADAAALFAEALRIAPQFPDAHYQLGRALLWMGNPGEAVRHFREELRLNPEHREAAKALGEAERR